MLIPPDRHLAYCTNIHRGDTWNETFHSLETYTLAVKRRVAPNAPYAIGLRLSAKAAQELSHRERLLAFQHWLEENDCYVFTINGFPYGSFHGTRVKENVYLPDWSSPERLEYTNRLFDLLSELLTVGNEGSVSTVPGSFKRFVGSDDHRVAINENLLLCHRHIESLCERRGQDLHLGLEPEPLGLIETSEETADFFEAFWRGHSDQASLQQRIGVNYDTCHLAIEHEDAYDALGVLTNQGIRISKIHLSSALALDPRDPDAIAIASEFQEDTYLHQVIARDRHGKLVRYEDLDQALAARNSGTLQTDEWRVHFHIPLYQEPRPPLGSTRSHILDTLNVVQRKPDLCRHFEMETYTWEALPARWRQESVVDQLVREYEWTLARFAERKGTGK